MTVALDLSDSANPSCLSVTRSNDAIFSLIVFIGARPALIAAQGKGLIAYGLSKSLLFKLAEYLNEAARGMDISVSVIVPSTLDTPLNRKSMPDVNPGNWVKPSEIAETLEFLVSEKSSSLRETVLKIYNNA